MERLDIPRTDDELRARLAALRDKAGAIVRLDYDEQSSLRTAVQDGHQECQHCGGSGWEADPSNGGYRGRYRRCEHCTPTGVIADGVPYEFYEARFDNYRDEDGNRSALEKARKFLDGARDLYLCGGVGAGKSRMACSILNEYARSRKTCWFARVPMVLHQLQPGRESEDVEQRLFATSLLVLDDIGAERDQATDYTRRTLLMIYEERGDRGLRTIFTSNKSLADLSQMQDDDRLASRIAGRADVVKLTTPDQRMARRKP